MALATSNIVPKYPSLTSSLGNKGLIKPSTTTQTTTPQTISSNPLGKVLPALGSIANIGGSSSNIYQNMPTNAPNTSMNPAASPVPNASSSVMGVVSPKTPTPVSPSVYNINGSGMGANTSNPNFSGVSGGTAGTPVAQTPQTQQQNTFLVKNNQTGEVSNMTPDQYNLNKDNFSLASATKPGEIAGLGTQNQDTSSYQALIQQAADAQAAARNFNQNLTNAKTAVTQTGSDLPFQTGAQEGLNRQYGAQAQALATAAQNATQLAGLAKPEIASYGQTSFNPLNQQFGQGGGSIPDSTMQQYAQMAANGQYSAIPSSITSNIQLNAQLNDLAKKINPNYNPVTSSAQSGVQTQQTQQVEAYKSALQQAQNLQSQFTDLIQTFGLNPNDVNALNSGLQLIARNTSSPQYKMLNNYVNDLANTYAQILTPSGGAVSDMKTQIATSMLDATQKGQSIIDVMKSLDAQAQAKIAGVPTIGTKNNSGSSGAITWDNI